MFNKKYIIHRIQDFYELTNKGDVARFLGITPQTLSNWIARDSIDYELIFTKCKELNYEYILTGKGLMLKNNSENFSDKNVHPKCPPKMSTQNNEMYTQNIHPKEKVDVLNGTFNFSDNTIIEDTAFDLSNVASNYIYRLNATDEIIKSKDEIIRGKDEQLRAKDELIKAKEDIIRAKDEVIEELKKSDKYSIYAQDQDAEAAVSSQPSHVIPSNPKRRQPIKR